MASISKCDQEWRQRRKTICSNIDRYRKLKSVKHREVAKATKRTIWTSIRWCGRGNSPPNLRELFILARLFEVRLKDLIGDD